MLVYQPVDIEGMNRALRIDVDMNKGYTSMRHLGRASAPTHVNVGKDLWMQEPCHGPVHVLRYLVKCTIRCPKHPPVDPIDLITIHRAQASHGVAASGRTMGIVVGNKGHLQ
jgi:hypothetical protein